MTIRQAIVPPAMRPSADTLSFSPAIRSGDHVFFTGMTGSGPGDTMPDDPTAQFEAVFDKIALVLAEAGLTLDAVVEVTSFHVSIRDHFDAFENVLGRRLSRPGPAWTAVGVAELRRPGAFVEVRVIARSTPSKTA